jgi:hypothetical protein
MADNNTNGHNGNGLHNYMVALLAPVSKTAGSRRAWGIAVEDVWVPYFTATNVKGITHLEPDVLGKPLRLAKNKDGSVRFSDSGRPVMRMAKDLNTQISVARDNFVASLQAYTGMVMEERPEDYKDEVELAQAAAIPIFQKEASDIQEANRLLLAISHPEAAPVGSPEAAGEPVGAPEADGVKPKSRRAPKPEGELVGAHS